MSDVKEAIARKFPEGVVFVSSISKTGKANVMPAGWCMFTLHDPALIAVSIGKERYTHDLILETGQFILALPSFAMARDVRFTGTRSGRDTNKMAECGLRLVPADEVEARRIEGAVADFECRLHSYHPTGDHTIFVGEAVAAHVGGAPGTRLMNFGQRQYALALMDPRNNVKFEE